jgi:hypothetical protein
MRVIVTMLRVSRHKRDIVTRKLDKIDVEMARVSTARKLGIATRIAGQQVRRTRTFGAVMKAVRATTSHLGRVLGQLWLEVTGFVFLTLATIGLLAFIREYNKYHAGRVGSGRVILAICFTLLFGWFGVSSFWSIRRRG